nr:hypothetical protein [uncultured Draconibacterium sp.]
MEMEMQVPHIVIVLPDKLMQEGLPTKMNNGGQWVMWSGTPYIHIIIPVPRYVQE